MYRWNDHQKKSLPSGVRADLSFTLSLPLYNKTFEINKAVYNSEKSINKNINSNVWDWFNPKENYGKNLIFFF